MEKHSKVVIIGAGPAGYTAAIYAARAMLEPRLIAGLQPGGQLTITTDVENYPGFPDPVQGPELMERMSLQAEAMGALIESDIIVSADLGGHPFRLTGDSGIVYTCDALIIATGAQARWLGLPTEDRYKGYGVSACATCDGPFYRGKKVAVVGGGNTAVEEALFLTNFAEEVTLIHRRDTLRAEQVMQHRLLDHPKVRLRWNSEVVEVLGDGVPAGVTGLSVLNQETGETDHLNVHGLFVAIGHSPATQLFEGQLPMKAGGYLLTVPGSTKTAIDGVFAAGDVTDDVFRQAVTAAGMGCMAALEAERFLAGH
ncbi:thioredoxin-disulfide reductase [Brucella tritici]|uniref:Thioredoxin reductase n=1 Tax=Brucella tritici TaxID=94626 RepID=A0A6L3YUU2_9HYPH|nr:thioredoxin-disulfide reductase [Brucella tritici]KAB2688475.1 thioredoxin-disulfide reductase [Brucella tritici]